MLQNGNSNNETNPLESVADSLLMTITTLSNLSLQITCNVAILGCKVIWKGVELVTDVSDIFYRLATGTYEYEEKGNYYLNESNLEVATTKNSLFSINKDKIKEYKTNAIDVEYVPVDPLFFTEMPTMVKYKSNNTDNENTLKAFVGVGTKNKQVCVDIFENGSLLVGGMSRWGKTSFIYSFLTSLMERYSSNYLRIVLVDYKMVDLTFIDEYKHILSDCITCNSRFVDMLNWVDEQINKRREEFRKHKIQNIKAYNKKFKKNKMQPVIIVIDEISVLFLNMEKKKADELRAKINSLLSISMGFGIYWIVCTQELSRETLGKMKNNFGQTVGFHTKDEEATNLIIRGGDLHLIENVGRAKLETSKGIEEFQSYFIELEELEARLKHLKKADNINNQEDK